MDWRAMLGRPDEPTARSAASIAEVEALLGHPVPADHAAFLDAPGGFRGPLRRPDGSDGRRVVLFGPDEILSEAAYDVFAERDLGDAIPVGGQDAWRWALRRDGDRFAYVEVDLGTGDVETSYGEGFVRFLRALVDERDA